VGSFPGPEVPDIELQPPKSDPPRKMIPKIQIQDMLFLRVVMQEPMVSFL